jgi:hypothetical protein
MKLIKAPEPLEIEGNGAIFLAGSIEMGKAENWQDRIAEVLKDRDITIFNPRRDDWDSSWVQSIDNPQFREQVEWELNALEKANFILMYFDPATKSPISLLELGLFAKEDKMVVCCPEGFWRKGNVDVVCKKYGVYQVDNLDELVKMVTV